MHTSYILASLLFYIVLHAAFSLQEPFSLQALPQEEAMLLIRDQENM
jgi:hypothetical protein